MTREVDRLSVPVEVPPPYMWPQRPVDRVLREITQQAATDDYWMKRAIADAETRERLKGVQKAVEDSDASALAEALAMDVENARTRRLPTRRGR